MRLCCSTAAERPSSRLPRVPFFTEAMLNLDYDISVILHSHKHKPFNSSGLREYGRAISVDKLPLLRVAEVAFLTPRLEECIGFYSKLGLEYSTDVNRKKIHFAQVGEQLFGFAHEKRGFVDGYGGFTKARFHVAFEIPFDQLDACVAFLASKGIKTSPKVENSRGWHGAQRSTSVYFPDPAGNIMELWAPSGQESEQAATA